MSLFSAADEPNNQQVDHQQFSGQDYGEQEQTIQFAPFGAGDTGGGATAATSDQLTYGAVSSSGGLGQSDVQTQSQVRVARPTHDHNWQELYGSVRERNKVMCNNSLMSDCQIVVGGGADGAEKKTYPVHKYILATGSNVFYALFYGDLKSSEAVIRLEDDDPEAFFCLLKFLYYDCTDLHTDTVLPTLHLAKKYLVPAFAQICIDFLEANLNHTNACLLLSQCRLYDEEIQLRTRCLQVIDAQGDAALEADSFVDIDHVTLCDILNRDTLNVNELTVYKAAIRWAKCACEKQGLESTAENQRSALVNALYLIHIPCLRPEEFADHVAQSGILSTEEANQIFMWYLASVEKPHLPFICVPRTGLTHRCVQRFQSSAHRSNQWRYRGRCDSIKFSVNHRIFLFGLGLYGSSQFSSAEYNAQCAIKLDGEVLYSKTQKILTDGTASVFPVYFDLPLQIEPQRDYMVNVTLQGDSLSYFGQEGLAEVTDCSQLDRSVVFQFSASQESSNGTGVQGGQIPELYYIM